MDLKDALTRLGLVYADPLAWAAVVDFSQKHWGVPAAAAVAYLFMVYAARKVIPAHPFEGLVDRCFAAWSLSLSLFSCWGLWQTSAALWPTLLSKGLFFTVCADTASVLAEFSGNPAVLALVLCCFSKIPELGNPMFLILKRKPVRLLQWYHHISVMLFCWLALATEYTPGIWLAVASYFVHSIMYMYFFLVTFKGMQKVVKPIAPLITIIQITQMAWGLIINGIAVGFSLAGGNCQIQAVTVYCTIVMFASYFCLFCKLFLEMRVRPKKRRGSGVVRSGKVSKALMRELDGDARTCTDKKLN